MKHARLLTTIIVLICLTLTFAGCSSMTCESCHLKIDANSVFCSHCGTEIHHTHDFSLDIVSSKFKNTDATCTLPATYYYSCECGEKGDETFTFGNTIPHAYTAKNLSMDYLCSEATYAEPALYYYMCSSCNEKGTETFEHGTPLDNKWYHDYYVDVMFGERGADWYITTKASFWGNFENAETEFSDLLVDVLYDCYDDITIYLYEYGDFSKLLKNSSSEISDYYWIVLKNEYGYTCEARGEMYPNDDRIYIMGEYRDAVLDMMMHSETIKFFLENENAPETQYRFEIEMSNFNEVLAYLKR